MIICDGRKAKVSKRNQQQTQMDTYKEDNAGNKIFTISLCNEYKTSMYNCYKTTLFT